MPPMQAKLPFTAHESICICGVMWQDHQKAACPYGTFTLIRAHALAGVTMVDGVPTVFLSVNM